MRNQISDVQALLDRGETPKGIIDSGTPLESFYGKIYQSGFIFEIKDDGTGTVAALEDADPMIVKTWNDAREYCKGLELEGYDDWTLPNKEALNWMFENLAKKGLGGFKTDNYYWSSSLSSYSEDYYLAQHFGNGSQIAFPTDLGAYYVRAVRTF